MPTKKNAKIAFIGKFTRMNDEEYIAQGFETIGCEVKRIEQGLSWFDIGQVIDSFVPDILLYCKWEEPAGLHQIIQNHRRRGMKTICWLFDLYFNYSREYQVKNRSFFRSDYVFTTDGGQQNRFEELGVNHRCVRQGIRKEECFLKEGIPHGVIFVGSDNPAYPYRMQTLGEIIKHFNDFTWYGRGDTNEVRGDDLNELYGNTKVVVGDSVYSPYYWSNRVVETLGRGGFLIHPEVEGIKEEYPYLVTYNRGNITELKNKIMYYLNNEKERQELLVRNFEWVRDHYTIDKKCAELLEYTK